MNHACLRSAMTAGYDSVSVDTLKEIASSGELNIVIPGPGFGRASRGSRDGDELSVPAVWYPRGTLL